MEYIRLLCLSDLFNMSVSESKKVKLTTLEPTADETAETCEEKAFRISLPVLLTWQTLLSSRSEVYMHGKDERSVTLACMRPNKLAKRLKTVNKQIRADVFRAVLSAGPVCYLREQYQTVHRMTGDWLEHCMLAKFAGHHVCFSVNSPSNMHYEFIACDRFVHTVGSDEIVVSTPDSDESTPGSAEITRVFLQIRVSEHRNGLVNTPKLHEYEYSKNPDGTFYMEDSVFDDLQTYYANMPFTAEHIEDQLASAQSVMRNIVHEQQMFLDKAVLAANRARFADVETLLAGAELSL